ncbi:hypothetical protein QVA66_06040 [Staphylococcus chromogenes]|nr:hypothetical protein [Staphylococcus chromogenes]
MARFNKWWSSAVSTAATAVAVLSYPLLTNAWNAYFDPSAGMGGTDAVPVIVGLVVFVGICNVAAVAGSVVSVRRAMWQRQSPVLVASAMIVAAALLAYFVSWMYSIKLGYQDWALTPELAAVGRFNRNCFTVAMLGAAGTWVGCLFDRKVVE